MTHRFLLSALLLPPLLGMAGCRRHGSGNASSESPAWPGSVIYSSGTIGLGGTISQAFDRAGVSPTDSFRAQVALRTLQSLRAARPSHRYEIVRSTASALLRMDYYPDEFEFIRVEPDTAATFKARRIEVPFVRETLGAQGTIENSLWESMTAQGIPPDIIWKFADVFGWRVDFLTEPRRGDRFRVLWSRDRHSKGIRDGDILAASYINEGRPEIMAFLTGNDYYDREGQSLRGEFLRAPLAYRRISSGFSNRRKHPILRYYRPHHGTDYSAPSGTPVQSIGDGRVISASYDRGLGNAVRIRHAGSYVSIYGHLRGFARGIRSGAMVKQGQTVGYVGSTGLSTGPHLHFAFEAGGRLVNFLSFKFRSKARSVPPDQQEAFVALKRKMLEALSRLPAGSAQVVSL